MNRMVNGMDFLRLAGRLFTHINHGHVYFKKGLLIAMGTLTWAGICHTDWRSVTVQFTHTQLDYNTSIHRHYTENVDGLFNNSNWYNLMDGINNLNF